MSYRPSYVYRKMRMMNNNLSIKDHKNPGHESMKIRIFIYFYYDQSVLLPFKMILLLHRRIKDINLLFRDDGPGARAAVLDLLAVLSHY